MVNGDEPTLDEVSAASLVIINNKSNEVLYFSRSDVHDAKRL